MPHESDDRMNSKFNPVIWGVTGCFLGAIIVSLVFFLLVSSMSHKSFTPSQSSIKPSSTPTMPPHSLKWVKIATFSGRSWKTTQQFTVGDKWKVSWNAKPGNTDGGLFAIELFNAQGLHTDMVANIYGGGTDVYHGLRTGTYSMKIYASAPYNVTLWDWR